MIKLLLLGIFLGTSALSPLVAGGGSSDGEGEDQGLTSVTKAPPPSPPDLDILGNDKETGRPHSIDPAMLSRSGIPPSVRENGGKKRN